MKALTGRQVIELIENSCDLDSPLVVEVRQTSGASFHLITGTSEAWLGGEIGMAATIMVSNDCRTEVKG